jgi:vitamin B12 transporter
VINITTLGAADRIETLLRAEGGSFSTYSLDGRVSAPLEGGGVAISGAWTDSSGIDVAGQGGEKDGYSNRSFSASARGALGFAELTGFGAVRLTDADNHYDDDLDFDGRLDNSDRWSARSTALAGGGIEGALFNGDLTHLTRLGFTAMDADFFADGARASANYGVRYKATEQIGYRFETFGVEQRLTGIVEWERERYKNRGAVPGAAEDQQRELDSEGYALDYSVKFNERFSAGLSGRIDQNDLFDDATTWRANASLAFPEIGGRLRASGGQGVKNPGVFELYGFFPAFFVGNPDLKPERSTGFDVGWDQSFGDGALEIGLTYFHGSLKDEIYTDFSVFPSTARNQTTDSKRQGIEAEAVAALPLSMRLRGSLAWLDADEAGFAELRRPEWSGSLRLSGKAFDGKLDWAGALDYVGEQDDTDFFSFSTVTLDSYVLASGSLRYALTDHLSLDARVENGFDENIVDVVGYAQPGAAAYVGFSIRN